MGKTKIEWATHSWPVVTGCSPVSSGCTNCYAARMAATRLKHHPRYAGLATIHNGKPKWTGEVRLNEDVLEQPLHWRKPAAIFVASMSDFFHPAVPLEFQNRVFSMIRRCPQHAFQILTKRAGQMAMMEHACGIPELPNLWLGVSIENQATADERIPLLLHTAAAVRFVSYEPALGSVDLSGYLGYFTSTVPRLIAQGAFPSRLDWVICGGESGPSARPMHPDWARAVRDQCQAAGVPFFFKQWGAWVPQSHWHFNSTIQTPQRQEQEGELFYRTGKKISGRWLDGVEWNQMPSHNVTRATIGKEVQCQA